MPAEGAGGARGWVLVGPTASGKTEAAHRIARRRGWGIVSADSMMVYRGMDTGTAKPAQEERRGIPYVGLDFLDPSEECSAGLYLEHVRASLRNSPPAAGWIVAGGTGLYVKCLTEGLDAPSPADPAARAEAADVLARGGLPALRTLVREAAPAAYGRLADPQNPRRLVRAYEIARAGGGDGGAAGRARSRDTIVGLRPAPAALARRIAERVERMFAGGLLDEARALEASGARLSSTAAHAIGYREARAALAGACTVEEAKAMTVRRTRQYAKRQMTWFRHQAVVDWIEVGDEADPDIVAREVEARWEQHGPARLVL